MIVKKSKLKHLVNKYMTVFLNDKLVSQMQAL